MMLTLKVAMPLMLDDTLKVNVALIELPTLNDTPSLFQLTAMGPFALSGFQPAGVMLSVIAVLPVFLT